MLVDISTFPVNAYGSHGLMLGVQPAQFLPLLHWINYHKATDFHA